MASQVFGSWKGVVQKNEQLDAELALDDSCLVALEANLHAAEDRVEAAETRYLRARRQVATQLADGPSDGPSAPRQGDGEQQRAGDSDEKGLEASAGREFHDHHLSHAHHPKNTSARSEKEVSRDRWEAARAAEGRVRERAVKARERLRRRARDGKSALHESTAGVAEPEQELGRGEQQRDAEKLEVETKGAPTPELGLFESAAVENGAKGIAARLQCLKDRPNAAEKRSALVRVAMGGRENGYTFQPSDVVRDLQRRGLAAPELAADLLCLLDDGPSPGSAAPVPPEEWLAHAKKASTFERLDDKPFSDAETCYLKVLEQSGLSAAEAELEVAEARLAELVLQVEARFRRLGADADGGAEGQQARQPISPREPEVDADAAELLEEQLAPHRESHGSKNASALPEKVLSHQRWVAARGSEARAKEDERKVRDKKRAAARDGKVGAADVPEDDA